TASGNIVLNSGNMTVTGTVTSAGAMMINGGIYNGSTVNSYGWAGTTSLSAGLLNIFSNPAAFLSSSSANAFYWSGGTIQAAATTLSNPVTLSGNNLQWGGNSGHQTALTLSGLITLGGNTTLQGDMNDSSTSGLTITGQIQQSSGNTLTYAPTMASFKSTAFVLDGMANN